MRHGILLVVVSLAETFLVFQAVSWARKGKVGPMVVILLLAPATAWCAFVGSPRQPRPVVWPWLLSDIPALAVAIFAVIWVTRKRGPLVLIAATAVNACAALLVDFSVLYWQFGRPPNFTATLSRLDAVYFAIGTLSTAGTGTISAVSETARLIQMIQMILDIGLTVFAIGLVVARLSERRSPTILGAATGRSGDCGTDCAERPC